MHRLSLSITTISRAEPVRPLLWRAPRDAAATGDRMSKAASTQIDDFSREKSRIVL
jgi:hypothetical protein